GVRCVMFEPDGGNVDPSGVTQAYASGARKMGADIHRFTPVIATNQNENKTWDVITPNGTINTQWVVNVAGLWGREVAAMAGVKLPLQPTEHQYLVTDTIPEIEKLKFRLPSVADRDGEYYMRQEGNGLLIGAYEKDVKFWAEDETPSGFGHELFADDLDRIMENIMRAMDRVPAAAGVGIKRIINGPMIWSPDSSALYGPVPELTGYFCCNGIIPGFSQSGGLGLMTAQWIIDGEPEFDMFPWDVARFGSWANKKFTKARVQDQYSNRFKIHFPNEEREAGRPVKMRPIYQKQKSLGAVFGLNFGWEHPLWFAGEGQKGKDTYGFDRQNWFEHVGNECRALRSDVGIIDISNFAKYEIKGPGSRDWLDKIVANKVPNKIGFSCLTPLLGTRGGIAGDFTITQLADDHYWMVGSGMAERYHQRYFNSITLPREVSFISKTSEYCGFNIAGPKSRELLARLSQTDFRTDNWKFMQSKKISIVGEEAIAIRISFTGDLGWEVYVKEKNQIKLYEALFEMGSDLKVKPVGSRALTSLRIEKGYGSWGREYSPEYWPQEVGLESLIKMDKPDFLGKKAYKKLQYKKSREQLVILEVKAKNADASGGEPIFLNDGTPVGRVSSGAYGYTVNKSLALCFVKTEYVGAGNQFNIAILGIPHLAIQLAEAPFDPQGRRLRT
ncbi:FAD-dependent oxidoreductase, partial [Amylibacter sp.]|nr:FAD-dependent oxidoreductase [Amylibacter sp.]